MAEINLSENKPNTLNVEEGMLDSLSKLSAPGARQFVAERLYDLPNQSTVMELAKGPAHANMFQAQVAKGIVDLVKAGKIDVAQKVVDRLKEALDSSNAPYLGREAIYQDTVYLGNDHFVRYTVCESGFAPSPVQLNLEPIQKVEEGKHAQDESILIDGTPAYYIQGNGLTLYFKDGKIVDRAPAADQGLLNHTTTVARVAQEGYAKAIMRSLSDPRVPEGTFELIEGFFMGENGINRSSLPGVILANL